MRYLLTLLLLCPWLAHGISLSWYGSPETGISSQTHWQEDNDPVNTSQIRNTSSSVTNVSFYVMTNSVNPVIPPGNYKMWYKCNPYPQSYKQAYATVSGGGTPVTAPLSFYESDYASVWKYIGIVNVPTQTDRFTFTITRTNLVQSWPHNAHAVYANTDTNVTLIGNSEAVQTWIPPTTTNTSAAIPGNILPNSSFEMPPPAGPWSVGVNASRYTPIYDAFSSDNPHSGKTCLRLDFSRVEGVPTAGHVVQSRPVRLRSNRAHSLSVWARSSTNGSTLRIFAMNPVPYPAGETFPPQPQYSSTTYTLTSTWTQYKLENQVLWEYPYCEYYPYFDCKSPNGGQIYLDDAQLEEGATATTYVNQPFTLGLDVPSLASLLYPNEVPQIGAIIHHVTPAPRSVTINWNLFYRGVELVQSGSYTVSTTSGNFYTNNLGLANLKPGFYRYTAHMQGDEQYQAEADFSVCDIPPMASLPATNGVIGYHGHWYHFQQQLNVRAGLKNYRTLSPGQFFRFSVAHPTTNTYVWFDTQIAMIQQYGIEILGELEQKMDATWINRAFITHGGATGTFQVGETVTVSSGATGRITWIKQTEDMMFPYESMQLMSYTGTWPVGATVTGNSSGATCTLIGGIDNPGGSPIAYMAPTFALDQWRPYCSNIVAHYTNVTTWEMLNEPGAGNPNFGGDAGVRFAAHMTREGIRGIRDVRSTDKICILGGSQGPQYATILWDNIPTAERAQVFAASFHLYVSTIDGRGLESVQWAKDRNLEAWNTETGYEDGQSFLNVSDVAHYKGFSLQPYIDSERDILKFARMPRMIATNVIESTWPGMQRHYYYDIRSVSTASADIFSQAGSHYTTIQMHDTYKVKMPTLIFQNGILERYSLKGLALSNSMARIFYTEKADGTPWLALYSPRITNVNMAWSLTSGQYETYNLEGGLLPTAGLNVSFGNMPVFIKGIGGTTRTMLVLAAQAATYTLVADTTPPILLFRQCPIGNIDQRRNEAGFVVSVAGYDQISTPWSGNTHALKYRYKFDSNAWTPWIENSLLAPNTFDGVLRHSEREDTVRFVPGPHTLYVECMDEAGNTNGVQRSFTIL